MRKPLKNLLILLLVLSLPGCTRNASTPPAETFPSSSTQASKSPLAETTEPSESPSPPAISTLSNYLFKAQTMETIQLTGQEILDDKEADMKVVISDHIEMDFHISRNDPRGIKLYAIYNSKVTNLANNYVHSAVFDNQGEVIPDYTYQISCYDFNNDGSKEIVIACGNNKDTLSLFVFGLYLDSEMRFSPMNYIRGYTSAYVNERNQICVPSPNEVKTYQYNIQAYDAEYARLSGPLKISVDHIAEEQLQQYKNAYKFVLQEEGATLLVLPQETLKNFRISQVEYNIDNEKFDQVKDLYLLPSITPDKPLVLKFILPTVPNIKVSYITEAGIKQSCIMSESGIDGSIFLIEQGVE